MFQLRELTPLVSRRYCGIAPPLMNSSWCDTPHRFFQSTGSGLLLTENTEYLFLAIPFVDVIAIRWHPLLPLDIMCRGPHQHLDIFQLLIGLTVRNTILAPDDLCYHRQHPLTPCMPIQTWSCISCSAFPWKIYTHDTCV